MVGEMRLFSNNGLKKDWKTVIVVRLRQRQCKEGWGSLSPAIRSCFWGNRFKVFLVVLKHFNEFSMSFCVNTRGRNTLASLNVNPLAVTRSKCLNERTVNRSWSNLSTMKGGHALGTVNQSSEQVFAD